MIFGQHAVLPPRDTLLLVLQLQMARRGLTFSYAGASLRRSVALDLD
jgi:hypothetical protein